MLGSFPTLYIISKENINRIYCESYKIPKHRPLRKCVLLAREKMRSDDMYVFIIYLVGHSSRFVGESVLTNVFVLFSLLDGLRFMIAAFPGYLSKYLSYRIARSYKRKSTRVRISTGATSC